MIKDRKKPSWYKKSTNDCYIKHSSLSLFLSTLLCINLYFSLIWFKEDREWVDVTEGITPSDVLPYDWSYFTYQGSLTTPPCFETVTWINMRCPIKVSKKVWLIYMCMGHLHLKMHVSKKYLKCIFLLLNISYLNILLGYNYPYQTFTNRS